MFRGSWREGQWPKQTSACRFVTGEASERREDNTHLGSETASALILVRRGREQKFIDKKKHKADEKMGSASIMKRLLCSKGRH